MSYLVPSVRLLTLISLLLSNCGRAIAPLLTMHPLYPEEPLVEVSKIDRRRLITPRDVLSLLACQTQLKVALQVASPARIAGIVDCLGEQLSVPIVN